MLSISFEYLIYYLLFMGMIGILYWIVSSFIQPLYRIREYFITVYVTIMTFGFSTITVISLILFSAGY